MHPILAELRNTLRYLGAWALLGGAFAALLRWAELAGAAQALLFALPLSLLFGVAALSAYYVCRGRHRGRRDWALAASIYGASSLLIAGGWLGLAWAWNQVGLLSGQGTGLVDLSRTGWLLFFLAGLGLYLLSLMAHELLIAIENAHMAAQREAEARLLTRESELQLLRAQIQPHFLFNSLNAISALTSLNPAGAREMTIALAQFFRLTLAMAERERMALSEELALCEHYLLIEQYRLGERLRTGIHLDEGAGEALIPPLLLQPVVENALKHGIRQLDEGGLLSLHAVVRDEWLHLRIRNPLAMSAIKPEPGLGLGLRNTRERLAALYGPRARLSWQHDAHHFEVEITLPLERPTP